MKQKWLPIITCLGILKGRMSGLKKKGGGGGGVHQVKHLSPDLYLPWSPFHYPCDGKWKESSSFGATDMVSQGTMSSCC